MGDTLEVRIAHLEGAYEQVDRRLGVVESILSQIRSEINQLRGELSARIDRIDGRVDTLSARMDNQFHWLLGTILTTWVTVIIAIFLRR